jgi:hypothetical protein
VLPAQPPPRRWWVWGGAGRDRPRLVRALAAAKALGDAGGTVLLFVEQLRTHRKLCSWCTAASLAHVATVPLTLPDALQTDHHLRRREPW